MPAITLEQALLAWDGTAAPRWLGQSADFRDAWRAPFEEQCQALGGLPPGLGEVVWALPLSPGVVLIGRAQAPAEGAPPLTTYHALVVVEADYRAAGGDPFLLAEAAPRPWELRGQLPAVALNLPAPERTVDEVCAVLKQPEGPSLLGASQALVDGGRVAFVRGRPEPQLVRGLWRLLPTSTRGALWPASFAPQGGDRFHAVVVPPAAPSLGVAYLTEDQAADYPEGAYEKALQEAAETGDQEALQWLFARRSLAEVWRLGWWLLGALVLLSVALQVLQRLR